MPSFGYLVPTRGVVFSSPDARTLAARTAADVVGMAERAEARGYRSVWVGDSVLARPRFEPLSTLAAIAARTDAIRVGTAVYLPSLRHPVNVAHLTATVDQLSGGRLALGVGVGSDRTDVEAEFDNLDVPFEERGDRTDELLDVVTGLWSGEAIDYEGEHYELEDASIGFSPVDDPPVYLPVLVGDDEEIPERIRTRLLDHGDGWLPIRISPERYESVLDRIHELLETNGRNPATFDRALYLDVVVDADESRALEEARAFYDRYYPSLAPFSVEMVRRRGAFGPASTVAAAIDEYVEAGVETFVVRFPSSEQRTQLERFADAVDLG